MSKILKRLSDIPNRAWVVIIITAIVVLIITEILISFRFPFVTSDIPGTITAVAAVVALFQLLSFTEESKAREKMNNLIEDYDELRASDHPEQFQIAQRVVETMRDELAPKVHFSSGEIKDCLLQCDFTQRLAIRAIFCFREYFYKNGVFELVAQRKQHFLHEKSLYLLPYPVQFSVKLCVFEHFRADFASVQRLLLAFLTCKSMKSLLYSPTFASQKRQSLLPVTYKVVKGSD